jgi:hypothetical protein
MPSLYTLVQIADMSPFTDLSRDQRCKMSSSNMQSSAMLVMLVNEDKRRGHVPIKDVERALVLLFAGIHASCCCCCCCRTVQLSQVIVGGSDDMQLNDRNRKTRKFDLAHVGRSVEFLLTKAVPGLKSWQIWDDLEFGGKNYFLGRA